MEGFPRASACSASLTLGIQEDPVLQGRRRKRLWCGGNKTKQKFLLVPGILRCARRACSGHLFCGGKSKHPKQPSWERCPGLSYRTLGGLPHRVASQWAAGSGTSGRGAPETRGRTDMRALACLSPCCWHVLHRTFLPLAAISLPAVSQEGFYFYLNVPLSASARTVWGCLCAVFRIRSWGS